MPVDPTLPSGDPRADPAGSSGADGTDRYDRWALPERYEVTGRLGTGATGEVVRVLDRHLDVERAMKVLRFELAGDDPTIRRFEAEARCTARLAHPGVVSVHELGVTADGRPWFTMDLVAGRTLQEVIEAVHAQRPGDRWVPWEGFTLFRLVEAVGRVAQAVAYAHSHGVVHRDLKPANIMLGGFGEVVVMDWGISAVLGLPGSEASATAPAADDDPERTQAGVVLGTPAWMPPEQARGRRDEVGPHSDVYGLGAVLFSVLGGHAPFRGPGAVQALVAGRAPPDLATCTQRPCPAPLRDLVTWAMQPDPSDRPSGAAVFADELLAWLEGAQRADRARALVADATARRPAVRALLDEATTLEAEAEQILDATEPHHPVRAKVEGWRRQDAAKDRRREAHRLSSEAMEVVRSALELAPELPEAHDVLADHYRQRVIEGERRGDDELVAESLTKLRRFDRGRHADFLRGDAAVSLVTDSPGAEVIAHRQQQVDRRLVDTEAVPLGTTPLARASLPPGSWRLQLRRDGRAEVSYPIRVGRLEHWDGVPPGDSEACAVHLPRHDDLGPEDCYVPAGWFLSGGDPLAPDGMARRHRWCDAFVIRRYPVTNGEYLAFLDALVDAGRADEAAHYVPTESPVGTGSQQPVWSTGPDGRYQLGRDSDAVALGRVWDPREPVTLVDHAGAMAFAEWLAESTGRPWRLPHDQEWEKAARGVDGRAYPWGDFFDPSWARMATSEGDGASQVAVDAIPGDVGPYGVVGMAGNCRDRCANGYARGGASTERVEVATAAVGRWRMIRGGSWFSAPDFCRLAGRGVVRPDERRVGVGFRVAYSYAPAGL